jgi:hypothetical protein
VKRKIKAGSTSVIEPIRLFNSTDGTPLGGVVYNAAGLIGKYRREGDVNWTTITIVTATAGAFTSGGWATPGGTGPTNSYEVHIPNAALAVGAEWCEVEYWGAADMTPVSLLYELDAVDYQSATNFGLSKFADIETDTQDIQSRIPATLVSGRIDSNVGAMAANVLTSTAINTGAFTSAKFAAGAFDAVWTVAARTLTSISDSSGITTLLSRIGSVLTITGGAVTVGTNNDKTGYTLSGAGVTAVQTGLATSAQATTIDGIVDQILIDTDATIPGLLTVLASYVDTEVAAIKAKTDLLPGDPAGETSIAALDAIADAIKVVTDRVNGLIENSGGDRFTTKALETAGGGGGLDAAGVRAAIGLANPDLDAQLATKPSLASIDNAIQSRLMDYLGDTLGVNLYDLMVGDYSIANEIVQRTDTLCRVLCISDSTWTRQLTNWMAPGFKTDRYRGHFQADTFLFALPVFITSRNYLIRNDTGSVFAGGRMNYNPLGRSTEFVFNATVTPTISNPAHNVFWQATAVTNVNNQNPTAGYTAKMTDTRTHDSGSWIVTEAPNGLKAKVFIMAHPGGCPDTQFFCQYTEGATVRGTSVGYFNGYSATPELRVIEIDIPGYTHTAVYCNVQVRVLGGVNLTDGTNLIVCGSSISGLSPTRLEMYGIANNGESARTDGALSWTLSNLMSDDAWARQSVIGPTHAVIALGINDQATENPVLYKAGLTSIVSKIRTGMSDPNFPVIIISQYPKYTGATWMQLAAREWVEENPHRALFLDTEAYFGSLNTSYQGYPVNFVSGNYYYKTQIVLDGGQAYAARTSGVRTTAPSADGTNWSTSLGTQDTFTNQAGNFNLWHSADQVHLKFPEGYVHYASTFWSLLELASLRYRCGRIAATLTNEELENIRDEVSGVDVNVATWAGQFVELDAANTPVTSIKNYYDTLLDDWVPVAGPFANVKDIRDVTVKMDTMLVLNGAVYRYTAPALALAPTGGGGGTVTIAIPQLLQDTAYNQETLRQYRGTYWSFQITDLGDLTGYDKIWFTLRKKGSDEDSESMIQIETDVGALVANGAPVSIGDVGLASLTVGTGTVTIEVSQAITQYFETGNNFKYDLKGRTTAGRMIMIAESDRVLLYPDTTRKIQ